MLYSNNATNFMIFLLSPSRKLLWSFGDLLLSKIHRRCIQSSKIKGKGLLCLTHILFKLVAVWHNLCMVSGNVSCFILFFYVLKTSPFPVSWSLTRTVIFIAYPILYQHFIYILLGSFWNALYIAFFKIWVHLIKRKVVNTWSSETPCWFIFDWLFTWSILILSLVSTVISWLWRRMMFMLASNLNKWLCKM